MLVAITNTPRPYAWGSKTLIAELLGVPASGEPEAELWLGAHPSCPARILEPSVVGGAEDLAAWIAAEPSLTLGRFAASGRLPFLLKVLAAAAPLSLQAHPTPAQAIAGFARENALGVPLDAPHRNFRDDSAKPELIYALSPTFSALCGFRDVEEVIVLLEMLIDADAGREDPQPQPLDDLIASLRTDGLQKTFEWLIGRGAGVATLVSLVTSLATSVPSLRTVRAIAAEYPGDPGIVIALLVNHVVMTAGEAIYLPAGNIHAYLEGLGVELMASSDNVLRGGLTPKHVDVPELIDVLDFTPVPVPYLAPTHPSDGVSIFAPDAVGFVLARVTASAALELTGPAIALCTAGSFTLAGAVSSAALARGESLYVTPDEGVLSITGDGELFVATTG